MEKNLNIILQFNTKTPDDWANIETTLKDGEIQVEKQENKFCIKFGNGQDKWPDLPSISLNPALTSEQKTALKNLTTQYLSDKNKFIYDGSFRRESYAYPNSVSSLDSDINGCMYDGKYITNCGLFVQMIWMGRKFEDLKSTPSTTINKAFDWGYYFDFASAKRAYGVTKSDGTKYSGNTYLNNSGARSFITFDNAAAMAQELFLKGYEIPYSEVDVGDIVFYRGNHISDSDNDGLEQSSFKYITHVGIVYSIGPNGPTIAESTNAYSASVGKSGLNDDTTLFGNVRGAGQEQRVVMAARHPVAWGHKGNVPNKFTKYRATEVQS